MRNLFVSLLGLALFCSYAVLNAQAGRAETACPDLQSGETALDCPWAGIARQLIEVSQTGGDVAAAFGSLAPRLQEDLRSDSQLPTWLGLWGRSINFDEGAHGIIVDPAILDSIFGLAQVAPRQERIAHAGIEHTYGYLFSNLRTSYGYKRLRWVADDIESGFGLARGTLGPTPARGTLFSNLTYFAGRIALKDDALAQLTLGLTPVTLADGIREFGFSDLEVRHLVETVEVPRRIQLRTDIVKFKHIDGTHANQALLVYSILDSSEPTAKLISAFPVAASFGDGVFSNLGEDRPVSTHYNAFVDGLTNSPNPVRGSRTESP